MKQKIALVIWGVIYCLCVGLGHIVNATTAQAVALSIVSVLFFVPGFYLLVDGIKSHNTRQLKLLRIIGFSSLALTFLMLLANILSVLAPETLGNVLHEILIFVSAPMFACRPRALSLFLWAFLAFGTFVNQGNKQDQK